MSQRTIINFYNFHTNPPTHIRKAVLTCNTASDQILILPGCPTLLWERDTAEAGAHLRKHHWKHNFFFFPRVKNATEAAYINMTFSWVWLFQYLYPLLKKLATGSRHTGPDPKPFVINRSLFSTDFNGSWTKPKEDKISQQ